jgi:uncharacterized membrane protein YqgA involved in biofilm formation
MSGLLGTIVNAAAIIAGSIVGVILKGGIPEKINTTIMNGIALCVIYIGILSSLKANNMLLIIFSIVIGGVIGEITDIDKWLKGLGDSIEKRLKGRGGKVSEGFVTASLVYCVGAMAIVGSLESGLSNNHQTLFAKATLDGISAIVFASSLGIGVALSSVSVFLYQGTITLCAGLLKSILVASVISDLTAVGGLLIIGLALNMLNVTKIKVANLLPAIFIPIIYQIALNIIH